MQGDSAPCGTTDRNAAAPRLLAHAGSPFSSLFWVYFVVSHPHMQSPSAVLFVSTCKRIC